MKKDNFDKFGEKAKDLGNSDEINNVTLIDRNLNVNEGSNKIKEVKGIKEGEKFGKVEEEEYFGEVKETDKKNAENEKQETEEEREVTDDTETDMEKIKERVKLLKKKALSLPPKSGVYLMKNSKDKIIYVGKAKYLVNRVSQYFIFYPHRDYKTNKLVENIYDFDFIITGNEIEALILENQLIKLHTPKYNIKLKDDKNYPYLRIDVHSEYPVLSVVRSRAANDKSMYFGPYSNKGSIYEMIDEINKHFKLPVCKNEFPRDIGKKRPCLNYRINRCMGVCTGDVSAEEYREVIDNVLMFIKGEYESLIKFYGESMQKASENMDFEKAAIFRDKKISLEKLRSKQKIVTAPNIDEDVFGLYIGDTSSCISVFTIRYGTIIDKVTEHFAYDEILDEDGFLQYLQAYYLDRDFVPKQIVTSVNIIEENINLLQEWLGEKSKTKVKVICPKKGEYKVTADLAVTNARESQRLYKEKYAKDTNKLAVIAKLLGLEVLPQRIEAYDVSNSGSDNITCGMIVIEDGNFKKGDYKSFNIKSIESPDDYAAMSEAVSRRFKNYIELTESQENKNGFAKLPDLILLDGGKGHVSVIKKVLEGMKIDVPVYGMVKDDFHKTRVLTDGSLEINIAKDQTVFIFFYKIQEEVHRYSLYRMDTKRRKSVKKSVLHNIKGLGPAKIKNLLTHFTSIEDIKKASIKELAKVKGVTKANAESIANYFSEATEAVEERAANEE
ncbi:MAG: excinuclease ABC subunit UvrC [Oscillospiraceae bacterium]|nr:excinuclease ABC subunit UvrC [Oscillospiraceae bacterium]